MKRSSGFTLIELVVVIAVLLAASLLFFSQKSNIEVAGRDTQRKTAINAMYYSLEEVYFEEHGAYPRTISADILPSVDPELLVDPYGVTIGETSQEIDGESIPVQSNYHYLPTNCNDNTCQSYTLRTTLENEDDFVRKNRDRSPEN